MLRSLHTIEFYDFGLTDDGTLYYVMELLEGLDLKTLVDRHGPLPGQRVIHICDRRATLSTTRTPRAWCIVT